MDCGHVRPRFGRWKLASLATILATMAVGGLTAADPARTVLVFPPQAHWTLESLRDKVSQELPEALRGAGFEAITVRIDSPLLQQARHEGILSASTTPEQTQERRYALAVLAGLDAVLTTELTVAGDGVLVRSELAGAVSRRPVPVEAQTGQADPAMAAALAIQIAAAITPEVWQQAGADEAGRRAGAAERFAAGQQAMASYQYPAAIEQFEAALAGDGENAEYLRAASQAELEGGRADRAVGYLQTLCRLRPDDVEARVALGEVALQVGRASAAEAAFRAADGLRADDPHIVEGLARAYRAEGDFADSRDQYQRLMGLVPALRGEPPSVAAMLASLRTDSIRFAGRPEADATRALALLCLEQGEADRGIDILYQYHQGAARPAYGDQEYAALAQRLDQRAEMLADQAETLLRLAKPSDEDDRGMEKGLEATHDQSDRLADLVEMMQVSPQQDAAHRYRVFAYNLLNESNFEALLYARTNDASHEQRASVLREASRKAMADADALESAAAPAPPDMSAPTAPPGE